MFSLLGIDLSKREIVQQFKQCSRMRCVCDERILHVPSVQSSFSRTKSPWDVETISRWFHHSLRRPIRCFPSYRDLLFFTLFFLLLLLQCG